MMPCDWAEKALAAANKASRDAGLMLQGALTIVIGDAIMAERERCAKIVEGWHVKKGGYTELAAKLRTGMKV